MSKQETLYLADALIEDKSRQMNKICENFLYAVT